MPYLSLRRMLGASCVLAATAVALVGLPGCAAQQAGNPSPTITSTVPPTGGGTSSTDPTDPTATGGPPTAPRQVFFDPQDLRTPQVRAVLRDPAEVARFVAWLNTEPRPGMASDRLVNALRGAQVGDNALVVVSRLVGCDSVGAVELRQDGGDFMLDTRDVDHHEECVRPNILVAVYSVPAHQLPANPTIDGKAPDTKWR